MRIKTTIVFSLIASLGMASLGFAAEGVAEQADGRSMAFDKKKGNCLACHAIPSEPKAESPGNIGPPLVNMKERYPDRAKLRAQDLGCHRGQSQIPRCRLLAGTRY